MQGLKPRGLPPRRLTTAGRWGSYPRSRSFTQTSSASTIHDISDLPPRIHPRYQETKHHDLLGLQWPSPPRNIFLSMKDNAPSITDSFIEYAKHIREYPNISVVLEPPVAHAIHDQLPFPVFTTLSDSQSEQQALHDKIDLISTLGGDGTILRASSLFAGCETVPPMISFSMGTLGFLGEWKFKEYKRAFREVYMSGADLEKARPSLRDEDPATSLTEVNMSAGPIPAGWSSIRGKFMGNGRQSRVLIRSRLKVGIFSPEDTNDIGNITNQCVEKEIHAMNEVIIHRGADPHLAIVEVFVGGRFLTEAVADGMIISTPTGSTAYSLSSGGSIVHPLVSSLLLTPVCPRSLSFRPLVLPANTPVTLRLSEKNRGKAIDISIDGVRQVQGLKVGMELRVLGEEVRDKNGQWTGGIPSIVRGFANTESGSDDGWVGGLNGLLKFNYPFGEE